LTVEDADLIEAAPKAIRGAGFASREEILTAGIVAGAGFGGELVVIAHTSARTEKCSDIGGATLEPWRFRGFSTAAVSLVAGAIQDADQIPEWSVGADNHASVQVAQKLGFKEVSRRTYVILEKEQ
jgi:predicted GNAT family acetyltransferase